MVSVGVLIKFLLQWIFDFLLILNADDKTNIRRGNKSTDMMIMRRELTINSRRPIMASPCNLLYLLHLLKEKIVYWEASYIRASAFRAILLGIESPNICIFITTCILWRRKNLG